MNFKGSYFSGQTPTERLRNKLNPLLYVLDEINNPEFKNEDIENLKKIICQISRNEIINYIEDCETLIDEKESE